MRRRHNVKRLNVISNGVYALAGAVAWEADGFSPFVLACFILAAGSAAYHYWHDSDDERLSYWSHHIDEVGMYFVFSAAVLMLLGWHTWFVALPVWAAFHFVALKLNSFQTLTALGAAIAALMLERGAFLDLALCLGVFAGAFLVRGRHATSDEFGAGHAVWHIWTGAMIALLYGAAR